MLDSLGEFLKFQGSSWAVFKNWAEEHLVGRASVELILPRVGGCTEGCFRVLSDSSCSAQDLGRGGTILSPSGHIHTYI